MVGFYISLIFLFCFYWNYVEIYIHFRHKKYTAYANMGMTAKIHHCPLILGSYIEITLIMLFDFRIIFDLHLYFFHHHAVSGIHSFPYTVNDLYIILNMNFVHQICYMISHTLQGLNVFKTFTLWLLVVILVKYISPGVSHGKAIWWIDPRDHKCHIHSSKWWHLIRQI